MLRWSEWFPAHLDCCLGAYPEINEKGRKLIRLFCSCSFPLLGSNCFLEDVWLFRCVKWKLSCNLRKISSDGVRCFFFVSLCLRKNRRVQSLSEITQRSHKYIRFNRVFRIYFYYCIAVYWDVTLCAKIKIYRIYRICIKRCIFTDIHRSNNTKLYKSI